MKFNSSILHSRVAQRILILFLLASLLPATASILLSLGYTHHIHQNESDEQLYQVNKSYGLSVFERLELLATALRETATHIKASREYNPGIGLSNMVQGMAILKQDGTIVPLANTVNPPPWPDHSQFRHLATGEAVITNSVVPDHPAQLFITIAIEPGRTGSDLLITAINNTFIWGEKNTFPYMIDYSVFDDQNRLLFSSYPDPDIIGTKLAEGPTKSRRGIIEWARGNQNFQASIRTLFMDAKFAAGNWQVVAVRPENQSGTSFAVFQTILIPIILLSVLLVSLFSISQIRRTLFPLEKLTHYIKHVANREFKHQLDFNSGDEFDELAIAFNNMSNRLAKQFEAMTILSEIDQSILSSPDFRQVQTMVLNSMCKILPARIFAIGIIEKHRPDYVQTYILDTASGRFHDGKHALSHVGRELLSTHPDGLEMIDNESHRAIFDFTSGFHIKHALALPIIIDDNLAGFLGLGLDDVAAIDSADRGVCRDIADRLAVTLSTMELDDKLFQRLNYDDLTGLPNRHNLLKDLDRLINQAHLENHLLAVMYIDLDRFKNINDVYGHHAGDAILKQAANRIAACAGNSSTLSRLNGDEFTLILPGINDAVGAGLVAEHIIESLGEPFFVNHVENYIGACIGIAIYPDDSQSGMELLMRADTAMSFAKETGRNRYIFFSEEMNSHVDEQMALERELRQAIDLEELELYYQPKVNIFNGRVEGAEALVRWNHPLKGQIQPGVFIPLAEDTGIINQLGSWALKACCYQFQSWRASGIDLPSVSVNVSTSQFRQLDFVDQVAQAIDETALDPSCLELEITESLIMENIDQTIDVLNILNHRGVRIAIDDFGTGYSSMNYLKNLPFDTLKIDRSFIKDLPDDKDSAAITKSVIAMAQAMNKTVIAEGAETDEQIAFLRNHNCPYVQGFYYSTPLPVDQFLAYVRAANQNDATRSSQIKRNSAV